MALLVDLTPLRENRDFRLLYVGQLVSFLGTMVSAVVVPYQVYELTHSSLIVGMLGLAQLVPVVLFGILGGAMADKLDRRRILIYSQLIMSVTALGLVLNSMLAAPLVALIFILTALQQAANGFFRPAMEALTQHIVDPKQFAAATALRSIRVNVCSIVGPALGGTIMAAFGSKVAYSVDFLSFLFAVATVWMMSAAKVERAPSEKKTLGSILEGIHFALARPVLLGTYLIDIFAMTFAFPLALFPALSQPWGGAHAAGILYSSMAAGALVISLLSGWTKQFKNHGAAVVVGATGWGFAILALGYANSLWAAAACLALAGATDGISALFRGVIWNELIPNEKRGRLAGLEMISYMIGPLLGNTRAGWMASTWSNHISIVAGAWLCIAGVLGCAACMPALWRHQGKT